MEIAIYTRIETLATEVGDRDTAQLARRIRREEERMAKYLDGELQRLVKEIVRAEIPREQRAPSTRRRRSATTSRSRARASDRTRSTARRSGSTRARSQSGSASRSS